AVADDPARCRTVWRSAKVARHRGRDEQRDEATRPGLGRIDVVQLGMRTICRVGEIVDQSAGGVEDPQALGSHGASISSRLMATPLLRDAEATSGEAKQRLR